MSTFHYIVFIGITLLALAGLFIADARQKKCLSGLCKMIASSAFMAVALVAGALETRYGLWMLLALVLAWWGDLLLLAQRPRYFTGGVVVFLLAHCAYMIAFCWGWGIAQGYSAASFLILFSSTALVFSQFTQLRHNQRYLIGAYLLIITLMVATALGAWGNGAPWLLPVGAALFFISDLFVARQRFLLKSLWNRRIGLPLYYTGQLLLAYSVAAAS